MDVRELVDHARTLDCIHCGLCLSTCPTYRISGRESSSPRGRIHLMRSVAEDELTADTDFANEMEFCLLCRHCESVCPAGVEFGSMMETTRDGLDEVADRSPLARLARAFGFGVVLPSRSMLSLLAGLGRFAQRTGVLAFAGRFLGARGESLRHLPEIPPANERRPLPAHTPAEDPAVGSVAVLEGCVMPELFGRVNRATVRALAAAGYDAYCARGATCCGSLHVHNGELSIARKLTLETIEAHERLEARSGQSLPLVVNSAGCGAHLSECAALFEGDAELEPRARAFAGKVCDFSEAFDGAARERVAARMRSEPRRRAAWDDPCHLCHGQQVRDDPRALLDALPGVSRIALEDSELCCGSAGIYSLLRPEDAAAVFAEKRAAFERADADCLVTGNPGCHLQWHAGLRAAGNGASVLHLAELVAERLVDQPSPGGSPSSSAAIGAREPR